MGCAEVSHPPSSRWVLIGWLICHLTAIGSVALRDFASAAHWDRFNISISRLVSGYLHTVGAEAGYGFFAPNIPGDYRLKFQLIGANGNRVELFLDPESSLNMRMVAFFDRLGEIRDDSLRKLLIEGAAASVWAQHPKARLVRVELQNGQIPTIDQYRCGIAQTYAVAATYEFSASELAQIVAK